MPNVQLNRGSARRTGTTPADCDRMKELFEEWSELELVQGAALDRPLLDVLPHVERVRRRLRRATRKRDGVADFDDLLIWARDLLRERLEVRALLPAPLPLPADRRVPGHRPDPGRDRDVPRERRPGRRRTGAQLEPTPGKLFVVGDPKQSIYRFRRADIGIYDEVKRGKLARRPPDDRPELPLGRAGHRLGERGLRRAVRRAARECSRRTCTLEPSGAEGSWRRPPSSSSGTRAATSCSADEAPRARGAQRRCGPARRDRRSWAPGRVARRGDRRAAARALARRRDPASHAHRPRGTTRRRSPPPASPTATRAAATTSSARRSATSSCVLAAIDDPADRISRRRRAALQRLRLLGRGPGHPPGDGRHLRLSRERSTSDSDERACGAFALLQQLASRTPRPQHRRAACSGSSTESRLVEFALTLPDGAQAAANLLAIADRAREFAAAGGGGPRPFIRWLVAALRARGERGRHRDHRGDRRRRAAHDHARRRRASSFRSSSSPTSANRPRGSASPFPTRRRSLHSFPSRAPRRTGHYPTPGYEDRSMTRRRRSRPKPSGCCTWRPLARATT